MSTQQTEKLAIEGGPKVRTADWPGRRLFAEEEKAAVDALFENSMHHGASIGYNGPEETAYCKEFAEMLGGGYADAVNSGTNALFVALASLDLPPYSEVIVPPISDPGGVMPVTILNCIPVPADAAPGGFNAGPDEIRARITDRTKAVIVMHAAGMAGDLDGILKVAREHDLRVVEDCAQAHGSTYKGIPVGTFGDVSAFSTMFGKTHAFGGQGGVVFTKDLERYNRVREFSDRGKPQGRPQGTRNIVGSLNFSSDEIHCAIGRAQLRKLPEFMQARRNIGKRIAEGCRNLAAVRMVEPVPGSDPVYWFLVFHFPQDRFSVSKVEFVDALKAEGVPFDADYNHVPMEFDWAINRHSLGTSGHPWNSPQYKGDANANYPLPVAHRMISEHFRISIHEKVDSTAVDDILAALRKVESAYLK